MRVFFGLILGCALTIGGAYLVDNMQSGPGARPMINWDVVAKNIDGVVALDGDDGTSLSKHEIAAALRHPENTEFPKAS